MTKALAPLCYCTCSALCLVHYTYVVCVASVSVGCTCWIAHNILCFVAHDIWLTAAKLLMTTASNLPTGMTALFVAMYFVLSIFFSPILSSIPPWATGGALVLVGALMTRNVVKVRLWGFSIARGQVMQGSLVRVVVPLLQIQDGMHPRSSSCLCHCTVLSLQLRCCEACM